MDVLSTSFYDHWWGCLVMPVVSLGLELLWICQNGSLEIHEFSGWKAHGSWERTLGNIGAIPILYAPCMACMVYTNCSAIVCLHALAIFGRICWYRINMNQPFQHQGAYGFVRGYHGIPQFFWMWKKMMNNWILVVFEFSPLILRQSRGMAADGPSIPAGAELALCIALPYAQLLFAEPLPGAPSLTGWTKLT